MKSSDGLDRSKVTAKIYGRSGALKDLLAKIDHPGINDLDDLYAFQRNSARIRQEKIDASVVQVKDDLSKMVAQLNHLGLEKEEALKRKAEALDQELNRLETAQSQAGQSQGLWQKVQDILFTWARGQKIRYIRSHYQSVLQRSIKGLRKQIEKLERKRAQMEGDLQGEAERRIAKDLLTIDTFQKKLHEERFLLYGAIGEVEVIERLKALPTSFHVINDYRDSFRRPIYNRAEDDRIHSIQVDHIVVGPTGIFIIETKNWSSESISNERFFSPAKQVRRAGFALFVLLNQAFKPGLFRRAPGNLGAKKISPRQIVIFRQHVPQQQVQFVKMLGIEGLNSYITYGRQEYSGEEVQALLEYFLSDFSH